MSTTQKVKIKLRSGDNNYSKVLDVGEAFYNHTNKLLYIGNGKDKVENLPCIVSNLNLKTINQQALFTTDPVSNNLEIAVD